MSEKQEAPNDGELQDMEAFVSELRVIYSSLYSQGAFSDSAERGATQFFKAWDAGCVRVDKPG